VARSIRIHAGAGFDRMRLEDLPIPEPAASEVRIKVDAFALNYGDFGLIDGDYPFLLELPSTFGDEASGVVDAVGPDVTQFEIGDRVGTLPWMNSGYGVNGEVALVPEYYVTKSPAKLSANESASIWITYLTAYYALYTAAKIKADDFILNCAASSSAGIAATQLAKIVGATVIGTTRDQDNVTFIKESGADHVISTDTDDVAAALRDITSGNGVRVIYDPVGGDLINQYANSLARNAIIFLYGSMSGQDSVVPLNEMILSAAILQPHSVYNYIDDPAQKQEAIEFITSAMNDGRLTPLVDRSFSLDNFLDAYKYQWAAKNRRGKILINL
jgi:NADPH2:quinone reductase